MKSSSKNWFKYILVILLCLLVRLIPFRAPNVEPILASQMPFSKVYGVMPAFLFGFLSILFFDLLTSQTGVWTVIVASTYGALGVGAFYFFKNKTSSRKNYVVFAIFGTIFFDAVTGLSIGPIFFGQSFMSALLGQIPFTIYHILGNIGFAFFLSPIIYKLIKNHEERSFLAPRLLATNNK